MFFNFIELFLNYSTELSLVIFITSLLFLSFYFEMFTNKIVAWIINFYCFFFLFFILYFNPLNISLHNLIDFSIIQNAEFLRLNENNVFSGGVTEFSFMKNSAPNLLNKNFLFLFILGTFLFININLFSHYVLSKQSRLEYQILILLLLLICFCLFISYDMLEIFVILETITLTSYILVGFEKETKLVASVGIQYLIIGSIAAGFLGLSLLFFYLDTGSSILTDFEVFAKETFFFTPFLLNAFLKNTKKTNSSLLMLVPITLSQMEYSNLYLLGLIFLIGTFFYKIKAAPFHLWAPTIYAKVSASTMVLLLLGTKIVFFFFFMIFFFKIFITLKDFWSPIFLLSGLLSLVVGILGAFDQKLLKKFFVFSSINHVGYLLLAFVSFDLISDIRSLLNYLIVYVITSSILWYVLTFYYERLDFLTNLRKILGYNEFLVYLMIVVIFSMSGIPPFAGFYAKYDILYTLFNSLETLILFLVLLLSVISFFYYLRIIKILNFDSEHKLTSEYTFVTREKWNTLKYFMAFLLSWLLIFFIIIIERGVMSIPFFELISFSVFFYSTRSFNKILRILNILKKLFFLFFIALNSFLIFSVNNWGSFYDYITEYTFFNLLPLFGMMFFFLLSYYSSLIYYDFLWITFYFNYDFIFFYFCLFLSVIFLYLFYKKKNRFYNKKHKLLVTLKKNYPGYVT